MLNIVTSVVCHAFDEFQSFMGTEGCHLSLKCQIFFKEDGRILI